ncbi:MAG TPA: YsnF/AvaK domain-containing protein [Pyrinomonadaceae bacterium]|nr:YsnF/AvaK domain-containing protein [Pyrinomonadaceae bacterium]
MTHTVVGLFKDRSEAQAAMQELMSSGFIKEDIDLSNRKFADNTGTGENYSTDSDNLGIGDRIANFFNSLFGDDETTARNYTNAASDADAILTVQADSDERARVAQQIFDRHGSMDVDENEARFSQQRTAAAGTKQTNAAAANTKTTIPVVEEKLNVGKQQVETGGARIRSRIVEKPVEANVRLREEHVVVNRRPVDREISDADLKSFKPGEMEITEHAEVPVVGKQARVVEEVEVGKKVTERNETVRDTVRSTDVDVNEFDKDVDKAKARKANP